MTNRSMPWHADDLLKGRIGRQITQDLRSAQEALDALRDGECLWVVIDGVTPMPVPFDIDFDALKQELATGQCQSLQFYGLDGKVSQSYTDPTSDKAVWRKGGRWLPDGLRHGHIGRLLEGSPTTFTAAVAQLKPGEVLYALLNSNQCSMVEHSSEFNFYRQAAAGPADVLQFYALDARTSRRYEI
jgi:TusA-related sulfurtransferase